jgi:predicted O-methyltransferase YrrM
MRRRDVLGAGLALAMTSEAAPAESRKEFLAKFPWTGACTTPGDAMLLRILIESRRARYVVEVGGNVGYGAIHMGIGLERTGGRLHSIEIEPRNAQASRKNLAAVGLDGIVKVIEGDALKVLPTLDGGIDLLFIDALKRDYLKYFRAVESKLAPGATIVADNVIAYAAEMRDFLEFMQGSAAYDSVILRASEQKNDGMLVAYRI